MTPRQVYAAHGLLPLTIVQSSEAMTLVLVGGMLWSLLTAPLLCTMERLGFALEGHEEPEMLAELVSLAMATARCTETRRAATATVIASLPSLALMGAPATRSPISPCHGRGLDVWGMPCGCCEALSDARLQTKRAMIAALYWRAGEFQWRVTFDGMPANAVAWYGREVSALLATAACMEAAL